MRHPSTGVVSATAETTVQHKTHGVLMGQAVRVAEHPLFRHRLGNKRPVLVQLKLFFLNREGQRPGKDCHDPVFLEACRPT